jgi:hypothetical protein
MKAPSPPKERPGPKTVRRDLVAALIASAPAAAALPKVVLLEVLGRDGVAPCDRRWLARRAAQGARLRQDPATLTPGERDACPPDLVAHLVQAVDQLGPTIQVLAHAPRSLRRRDEAHAIREQATHDLLGRLQGANHAHRQAVSDRPGSPRPRPGSTSEIVRMRVRRDGRFEVVSRLLIPLD